jgi:hypothetical protein
MAGSVSSDNFCFIASCLGKLPQVSDGGKALDGARESNGGDEIGTTDGILLGPAVDGNTLGLANVTPLGGYDGVTLGNIVGV